MRGSMLFRLAKAGGLCLVLAGTLSSCGGGGDDSGAGGEAGFNVELIMLASNGAERSSFEFGTNLVFNLKVTNRSGGTQVLNLPTGQIYDLAVLPDGANNPVWRWSFNRTFTPAATNLTFNGHQSITYPFVWDGVLEDGTQIMPGTYQFRGTLAYANYASNWRANDEMAAPLRNITVTP